MKRCIALLHHGWADWEAGFVLAALREDFGFTVRIATPGGVEVTSIGGIRAAADMAFAEVLPEDLDLLLVIGSERWMTDDNPEVVDLLRQANAADGAIGAICAGTLTVARAGLLDDRAHTSNSPDFLKANAEGYAGAALYVDSPRAVSAGGVVTAAGSAPGSFSVAVFRRVAPGQAALIDGYERMLAMEHRPGG
jgi:putative intracellular protease/amidase